MGKSVEEEYLCAIRTSSYTNLCLQVEEASSSAAPSPDYTVLLQPDQETLAGIIREARLPRLVVAFFNTTFRVCRSCGSLLDSINRARANQAQLGEARFAAGAGGGSFAVKGLRRFRRQGNPFREDVEHDDPVARQLMAAHRKLAVRRGRRRWRMAARLCGGREAAEEEGREAAQVGAAARGAFALERDMDTLGSMVKRVREEIDHARQVIGMLLLVAAAAEEEKEEDKEWPSGMERVVVMAEEEEEEDKEWPSGVERVVVMEEDVMRELGEREGGLMQQLRELEEYIFLCFLDINRTRRMVLRHIHLRHTPQ